MSTGGSAESEASKKAQHITYIFKIQKSLEAMEWISDFRKKYNLRGDFEAIEKFQGTFQDAGHAEFEKLRAVTEIKRKELDILISFFKQSALIEWLQTKMTDENDVRGLCMVAMESTRHEPIQADKWLFLSDAVAGFEDLIFHLGNISGLKNLLSKCKTVWRKVAADETLLNKWADVGKDIDWYKANEQWYGSEEQAALCFAQEVNTRGVYTIGNLRKNSNSATLQNSIKLDLISATNPHSEGMDQNATDTDESNAVKMNAFPKCADINYLHDIESKLMLISGDGKEGQKEVKQFVALLTAVESLTQAYVNLDNAGFMLFSDWEVFVSSKQSKDVDIMTEHTLTLKITFKEKVPSLSKTASIQDINLLTDILRDISQRWDKHVSAMRLKHYFLNDYSIQQIKYLCGQLGKIRQSFLQDKVFVMLSDLPQSDMTVLIQESLNEAVIIDDREDEIGIEDTENDITEDNVSEKIVENRNKRRAVRLLVNGENVTEKLAKAAVQAEGYQDQTSCSNWMLLHEYDDDLVYEYSQAFDQAAGFVYEQSDIKEDVSVLQSRSAKTLESIIEKLREKAGNGNDILKSVKTICLGYLNNTMTLTLQDYLSVNHLGKFLAILHSKMDGLRNQVDGVIRSLPPTFKRGSPNLILYQQQRVIPLLISLYAKLHVSQETGVEQSPPRVEFDKKDPSLPTYPEILICSEKTTVDEVERFMYRAMCKQPTKAQPLFCLAYAHKLDLNVSKAIETIFDTLSHDGQHVKEDYQLVIISSDPQHYVTACFEEYQLEKVPDFEQEEVHSYINRQMTSATAPGGCNAKVVKSNRSGVGKSLHVKKVMRNLGGNCSRTTVRLLEKHIDVEKVIKRLYKDARSNEQTQFIHFDLTPAVEIGIEKFMFDLLILGMITDCSGNVWRRRHDHSYFIELTKRTTKTVAYSRTLELLPSIQCIPPLEAVEKLRKNLTPDNTVLMNLDEFNSEIFQRPCQYLLRHEKSQDLSTFVYKQNEEIGQSEQVICIDVLLRHCGMRDPSWGQLKHFVSFLNAQLVSCEQSAFCQMMEYELRGLKDLAVKFMIRMSQDFATPSLDISDQSANDSGDDRDVLADHQIRRKWEENEHPYVFFNEDRVSMTFINVNINSDGNLLDKDGNVVERGITSEELVAGLRLQRIKLGHNFHELSRDTMIEKLCLIMGIPEKHDPDPTYELTTDNVLKMIAIYMRFRCKIPVIIMGETGCGKTRMVEFMNNLAMGSDPAAEEQMETLKIHGGIGVKEIYESVRQARPTNSQKKNKILFYDEANTTTAIYAIKEVMCDLTIDGKSFEESKLKIVAACNPYKQLSTEALRKLESSGLGYRVSTTDTNERLGNVAMRTLVYRVVALPPSIQPFVWDFGQLSDETENIYIEKMMQRLAEELNIEYEDKILINAILSHAQAYMKKQQDECRYVSLRDVERTIKLYKWFFEHREDLFPKIDDILQKRHGNRMAQQYHQMISHSLRSVLQAIGITYHVSLENREEFRHEISHVLQERNIQLSSFDINEEFIACQTAFHHNLKTVDGVAWNEALRENVYLMTVCADAKLPLYLIGKPGSSKSLAKTIVEANMKGSSSTSSLFKNLKKVDFLTYQCSAITQADGIRKIFESAGKRQEAKDLKKFVALVVLDEIGLAEDSPNMPLKILHPLLECGSASSGTITKFDETKRVAFIGISNWALDPAKMNRGIFVTRNTPAEVDLFQTAEGIFQGNHNKVNEYHTLLEKLTKTYLDIYKNQGDQYFGLRDYYSLIKMISSMSNDDHRIDSQDLAYVLLRNFSGGKEVHLEALKKAAFFNLELPENFVSERNLKQLVVDNLKNSNSRFLLLLTSQHSSVCLLHHIMPDFDDTAKVIFGSSFQGDHTYTGICRNINRIKVCMESGHTVVLLNMSEIHESLYDVLNQHFVKFGGQRYVALGLGSHRVWSRIHDNFRIIVIEKREIVQNQYSIALVNRLEKHHLLSKSLLNEEQLLVSERLQSWSKKFAEVKKVLVEDASIGLEVKKFLVEDAFVGSHEDTASSVVLAFNDQVNTHTSFEEIMLDVATADSVYRLPKTKFKNNEKEELLQIYMEQQTHDCLFSLLQVTINKCTDKVQMLEIVSFSNILTEDDRKKMETKLNLMENSVMLLSLQQFKVEQEYIKKLDDFFVRCMKKWDGKKSKRQNIAVLLIQTSQAHKNGQLIECAKHYFTNKLSEISKDELQATKVIIGFLLSTERRIQQHFNGGHRLIIQHTRKCRAVYVDELRQMENNTSTTLISSIYNKSVGGILSDGKRSLEISRSSQSHVLCLLQDCICEAMSRLRSLKDMNGRQLQRIEILQEIFKNLASGDISKGFLQILFEKMMTFQNSRSDDKLEWITAEACSPEKLQEGGTFGKTIHICLKKYLADMLAYIISIVDENNNLSILMSDERGMEWRIELWLQLFSVIHMGETSDKKGEYTVKTAKHLTADFDCKFPFSFIINKKLMHWYGLSQSRENVEEFFYNAVQTTSEKEVVKVISMWGSSNRFLRMMEAYAYDVMKFLFSQGTESQGELESLVKILFEISKQKWIALGRSVNGISVTFYTFMHVGEHLKMLSNIFRICPDVMSNINLWIEKQQSNAAFLIHEFALDDMLDWANKQAAAIDSVETCIAWMSLLSNMKKSIYSITDSTNSGLRKDDLQKKWKPLALLDMLLMHLLPGSNKMKEYEHFVGVIVKQAIRLFSGVQRMGYKSNEVLKITSVILRKCYENLKLNFMMNWQKPGCRQCGQNIQIPIKMHCGGFVCKSCMDIVMLQEHKTCPLCPENLPQDFLNCPPPLSTIQLKDLQNFQANCTSFFLEYLYNFCFEASHTADQEKMKRILEDIFASIDSPSQKKNQKLETAALNLDIELKSSVFQLLFKVSPKFIEVEFEKLLQDTERFDKSIVLASLKGFEDICSRLTSDKDIFDQSEELLRQSWKYLSQNHAAPVNFKTLKHVAQLRYALTNLVKCIQKSRRKGNATSDITPQLILSVADLCRTHDVLQSFITKTGVQLFGRQWLTQVSGNEQLNLMILADVTQHISNKMTDFYSILGDDYCTVKQFLSQNSQLSGTTFKTWFPRNEDIIMLKNLPKILATVGSENKEAKRLLLNKMHRKSPEASFLLQSSHLNNRLKSVTGLSMNQGRAIYQLTLLVVGVVACRPYLLKDEVFHLIINPENVIDLYWPAMPESLHNIMSGILQNDAAPYICPNGHIYYIGECRRPWVVAKCPECNVEIGGSYHAASQGNERLQTGVDSQSGYQLYDVKRGVDKPGDRITEQGAAVVQFILHACMLIAMQKHYRIILGMIHKDNVDDGYEFLANQLQINLENLSHGLGCNVDDGILILHLILKRIIDEEQTSNVEDEHPPDWSTMGSRKNWEKEFHSRYLLPVFQNEEELMMNAQERLDKVDASNIEMNRLLNETKSDFNAAQLSCFHPVLWKSIKHSNSSHLMHCIADSASSGQVLQNILQTPNLHLVQHLGNTLKLQEKMIQRYQNKCDMKDVEAISFKQLRDGESWEFANLIEKYINVWNEAYPFIKRNNSSDKSVMQYMAEMSVEDPITMALPSLRGRGKCAKLLSEHIIDIQNDFLTKCKDVVDGITEIEVSKLMPSHIVCVDKQRDLLPMIQLHTAYTITEDSQGRRHHIAYNIEALEKQAKEKYVVYKKMIQKKSLPCIKYTQDIGIGSNWDEVVNNVTQLPLPAQISQEVDEMFERVTLADVCEGVRTLTQAISFLAKICADSSRKLHDYLEKDLMLSTSHMSMIPKSVLICHVLALYQKLSCRKAVSFVQQGLDPYKEALQGADQKEIRDIETLRQLEEAFKHMDINSLQQHINEMLIKVPDFHSSWSLIYIFPELEFIEDHLSDSWYNRIPEEVCFRHVSHLFRLSVQGFKLPG